METWFKADRANYKIAEETFERSTARYLFRDGEQIAKKTGCIYGGDYVYFNIRLEAIRQIKKWHHQRIKDLETSIESENAKFKYFENSFP